jgi:O-antigen/teichoic acid export membrane protein
VKSYPAMMILSTGLVLCTLAAAVGPLLSMTGHERVLARLSSSAMILNVVLCALLIPKYSVEGAAAATALSTLYVNVAAFFTVYRVVGVNPSVFARGSK